MRKNITLLLLIFFILFLNVQIVFGMEFEGFENDLKKVEEEIKNNMNKNNLEGQNLFENWTEDDIINFFEWVQLSAVDYQITKLTISNTVDKIGSESNAVIRTAVEIGVSPDSFLLPEMAIALFLTKDIKERRYLFLVLSAIRLWAINSHRQYYQIIPDNNNYFRNQTVTVIRIKF